MCDHCAAIPNSERGHVEDEPALLLGRVARVLNAEMRHSAVEHRLDTIAGHDGQLVRCTADTCPADRQIIHANTGARRGIAIHRAIVDGKAPPRLVDRDNGAAFIEYRDLGSYRVENGICENLARSYGFFSPLALSDFMERTGQFNGLAVFHDGATLCAYPDGAAF